MGLVSYLTIFFAFIIVPIILIMAFVAPAKLDLRTPKNPTGKHDRKQSLVGLGLLWLIAVAVGGVTASDTQVGQSTVNEQTNTKNTVDSTAQNTKANNQVISDNAENKIEWYQDDLSKPINMVGVDNPIQVISSTGLKPAYTEKSTDSKGEPKQIYQFGGDTSLKAQFEHSPNQINLMWFQATDDKKTIESSQESLKNIYLISRALFGKDGADAVRRISIGGKYRDDFIGSYKANGQCVNYICSLNIHLTH